MIEAVFRKVERPTGTKPRSFAQRLFGDMLQDGEHMRRFARDAFGHEPNIGGKLFQEIENGLFIIRRVLKLFQQHTQMPRQICRSGVHAASWCEQPPARNLQGATS
jgi:hypothetical protein